MQATRSTVDLSGYPDLVMIQLGFRIGGLSGLPAFLRLGKGFAAIRRNPPDGLLGDERMILAWNHIGIRQYWRDFDSLERFTRADPHSGWWSRFMRDSKGSGFWHETYARQGIEAVYINMGGSTGLARFAPTLAPVGPLATSRQRLGLSPAGAGERATG